MEDTMSPNSLLEFPSSLSNLPLWLPLGPNFLSPALSDSSIQVLISLSFGAYSTGCPFPLWSRAWLYTSSFPMHRLPENSILQVCPPENTHLPSSLVTSVFWPHCFLETWLCFAPLWQHCLLGILCVGQLNLSLCEDPLIFDSVNCT